MDPSSIISLFCSRLSINEDDFCQHYYRENKLSHVINCNNYKWYVENFGKSDSWIYLTSGKNTFMEVGQIAEILCSLGYCVTGGNEIVFVTKVVLPLTFYYDYDEVIFPKTPFYYISTKYLSSVDRSLFSVKNTIKEKPDMQVFFKYVRWKVRSSAILVALRRQDGIYFHVLKWIALWL